MTIRQLLQQLLDSYDDDDLAAGAIRHRHGP